ncbi:TrbI/VirB10 family protein [Rhodopseudomonas sp.]|uniref:TrbI/VirB10 family protein n=1 Tax=Rhodopseudomonas sp. TaxID=1078 RepID=UPI0039E6780C
MTDDPEDGEGDAQRLAAMRLRPERPRVVRLSRKVLAGGTGVGMAVLLGAALWALQTERSRKLSPEELHTTDHHNVADGIAGLPRDYAGVPRQAPQLGPPLPGDLGRPILNAQGAKSTPTLPADTELQHRDREIEAARVSRLFVSTNVREQSHPATPAPMLENATSPPQPAATPQPSVEHGFDQNGQDHKLAFVNAAVDRRTTSPDRIAAPASSYVVQAGAIISASLITGIRSDLPGQITAQVTENIYDTPSGRWLLIPQGARLIGAYDSQVAFGQSRVLLVWTRLIMPNGRSIVLERQQGADAAGYSGLEDEVDHHWGRLFGAALLSTLLSVGSELGSYSTSSGNNSDLILALRRGASDGASQTGQQIVRRNLNIQPTLTIRPGFPVRVIVNRDLVLEPYKG